MATGREAHEIEHEMLARMTRYLDYFQALSEAAKSVTSTLDVHAVLSRVMETLTQLFKPRHWSLLLLDEARGELYFEIAVGEAADKIKNLRLKVGEGIAGWVAAHNRPLLVPKVADDPRFSRRIDQASDFQTDGVVCVPLTCRGRMLGVIEIVKAAADPEPFTDEHLQVLTSVGDFAAIAIDNARAFKQVEELTIVDEWTSLYNARYLKRCLAEEVKRAQRYSRELSVVFIDLDRFKDVNDTHGHAAGSAMLRHVGTLIQRAVRETDRAVRYGGDEFVIVMPETPKQGALALAERLREAVASEPLVTTGGTRLSVTASLGVAGFPDDAREAAELLEAADRAMYGAKAGGKNRVQGAGK
jgi:diguanylate cyclase (GGDEF)-like protein